MLKRGAILTLSDQNQWTNFTDALSQEFQMTLFLGFLTKNNHDQVVLI
jgi:hypothetical protein